MQCNAQMSSLGYKTVFVPVTFYPAVQSQWTRGGINTTKSNRHILRVLVSVCEYPWLYQMTSQDDHNNNVFWRYSIS